MIGEKIRRKRNELGMSMKMLAEKTGLTSGFISQVERELAEPSITSLRKIAEALDVAVFYFFTEERNERHVLAAVPKQIVDIAAQDDTPRLSGIQDSGELRKELVAVTHG